MSSEVEVGQVAKEQSIIDVQDGKRFLYVGKVQFRGGYVRCKNINGVRLCAINMIAVTYPKPYLGLTEEVEVSRRTERLRKEGTYTHLKNH